MGGTAVSPTSAYGLTKNNQGDLVLTSTANVFSGPTVVNAGALFVNGSLPAGSAVTVAANNSLNTLTAPRLRGTGTINGTIATNAIGQML